MFEQPQSICFVIPQWITEYTRDVTEIPDMTDRMRFVIEASRLNVEHKTGGPFAAAVFESHSGQLVALGVNLVTTRNASILHAEMVAIALAQQKLSTYDLGREGLPDHQLVSSTEPCAMCLGAIPWSGVRHTVTGAHDCDARAIGFDEGPKVADWQDALRCRGIEVVADVLRAEARKVLDYYHDASGHIYNAREGV